MVRAILAGNKTQTRRVIKPQPEPFEGETDGGDYWHWKSKKGGVIWPHLGIGSSRFERMAEFAPYKLGDVLWVRETWAQYISDGKKGYLYKADPAFDSYEPRDSGWNWRPSIHMPREAARIFLKVTDVRAERLQDITPEDAIAEGFDRRICSVGYFNDKCMICIYNFCFAATWELLNEKRGYGWYKNPWVWVIAFERTEATK